MSFQCVLLPYSPKGNAAFFILFVFVQPCFKKHFMTDQKTTKKHYLFIQATPTGKPNSWSTTQTEKSTLGVHY
jgi:hypothetical protein